MFLETRRPLRRRDVWMRQSWRHCSFNESDRMVARAMLLERVHRRSAPPWPCLCCTALDSMPQFKPGRDSISRSTHTHTHTPLLPLILSFLQCASSFEKKERKEKKKGKIFVCGKFLFECGLGRGFWSNINYIVKSLEIESRLLQSLQDDLFQFSFFLFLSISTNKSLIFFLKVIVILKLINFIEFHYWVELKYTKYL